MELADGKCIPCRKGDSALADAEVGEFLRQVPEWELVDVDGVKRLQRIFKLKNYVDAVGFATRIAMTAEKEDHHPLIILEWGRVTVQWWTHVVNGLHQNDFVMAAKTDALFG